MDSSVTHETILVGVRRVLSSLPGFVSILLATGTLASVLGWFQARAYFGYFGASWIAAELSPFQLIKFCWITVVILVVLIKAFINDYVEMEEAGKSEIQLNRTFNAFKGTSIVLFAIVLPLDILLLLTGFDKYQIVFDFVQAIGFILITSMSFVLMFVFNAHSKLASRMNWYLMYTIFVFAFYLLPQSVGKLTAKVDAHPQRSSLPMVKLLAKEERTFRLLYKNGDELYLADLNGKSGKEVFIKHTTDLYSISAVEAK